MQLSKIQIIILLTLGTHLIYKYVMFSTVGSMTVTRPPIYVEKSDFKEDDAQAGKWRELLVYSGGSTCKLVYSNSSYPTNPSLAPTVSTEELQSNSDRYRLIMDYLN